MSIANRSTLIRYNHSIQHFAKQVPIVWSFLLQKCWIYTDLIGGAHCGADQVRLNFNLTQKPRRCQGPDDSDPFRKMSIANRSTLIRSNHSIQHFAKQVPIVWSFLLQKCWIYIDLIGGAHCGADQVSLT